MLLAGSLFDRHNSAITHHDVCDWRVIGVVLMVVDMCTTDDKTLLIVH
jgi:hypothetical protein